MTQRTRRLKAPETPATPGRMGAASPGCPLLGPGGRGGDRFHAHTPNMTTWARTVAHIGLGPLGAVPGSGGAKGPLALARRRSKSNFPARGQKCRRFAHPSPRPSLTARPSPRRRFHALMPPVQVQDLSPPHEEHWGERRPGDDGDGHARCITAPRHAQPTSSLALPLANPRRDIP